jgi:hypothetical protein
MLSINFTLFVQFIFALWIIGGVLNIASAVFESDAKKQLTALIGGMLMLGVVVICMVL